jgi:large subunit ribosomal protein L35
MAYKYKPNKAVAKRFKVSKTGKLKRHHGNTSHLMSSRSANKRRHLRRGAVVPEVHARRLRKLMGISGKGPGKTAAARLAARKLRAAQPAAAKSVAAAPAVEKPVATAPAAAGQPTA